jgi:phage terminase large subunit GpA-like protein
LLEILTKLPPKLDVAQWADAERMLTVSSSPFPGRWKTERAEYQRGIMKAFSDAKTEKIVCMTSAQVGKTEIMNNICGFFLVHDPCPILILLPTLELARAWSVDRLAPMISTTPAIRDQIGESRMKDGDNTILQKQFKNGSRLSIAGSNSPASLSSRPIRIVLMDEVDRMALSSGSEGDPILLASRRTQNFFNRKIAMFSTPTIKGESRIESAFEESDRRYYNLKCHACDFQQVLSWGQVRWEKDHPETAKYHCSECDVEWSDVQRKKAIRSGEWIATAPFSGTAGFHLSGLYSPWVDIPELAKLFLESKHTGQQALRVFVNTVLAESWEENEGDGVETNDIMARATHFETPLPDSSIGVLCASADVQADRIETLVCGYSNSQTYVVGFQIFYGSPTSESLWLEVEEYLKTTWQHPSGQDLRITRSFIDSGYETGAVYNFCRKLESLGVRAIKGVGGSNRAEIGRPTKNNTSRCNVFPLGVNTLKTQILARLKIDDPKDSGFINFPDFLDEEFFLQLTSERLIKRYVKGIPRMEFKQMRPRNEALDLMVYNLAAFRSLNANMSVIQKKLEDIRKVAPKKRPQPRAKNWATNW